MRVPRYTLFLTLFLQCLYVTPLFSQDESEQVDLKGAQAEIRQIRPEILSIEAKVENLSANIENVGATIDRLNSDPATLLVEETELELKIELSGDILFDFDKADLRPAAEKTLKTVAELISSFPEGGAQVDGHTDSKGSDSYNLDLSKRRALAVKRWLIESGAIGANRLATRAWGESKPSAPNTNPDGSDNPDGRQKNRRVEIIIKKKLGSSFKADLEEGPRIKRAKSIKVEDYEVIVRTPLLSAPSRSARVLTELRPPTRLNIVGRSGEYLEVRSSKSGKPPGFVLARNVRKIR